MTIMTDISDVPTLKMECLLVKLINTNKPTITGYVVTIMISVILHYFRQERQPQHRLQEVG